MVNQTVMLQALGSFVYHELSARSPGMCSLVQDVLPALAAGMAAAGCKADVAVALPNVASIAAGRKRSPWPPLLCRKALSLLVWVQTRL